ncbi:MAG: DNA polymerase/3'-5' exonuclease PolX [Acidobacteria bacterium]|nr:DNA polymerase/3'-5' exonuclease PolX [Acidobacteriota bacterium]
MENRELARVFSEMADILELTEGNSFRIRSFRRVSQTIENLGFSLAKTFREDIEKVRQLPGIGEGTIRKIQELLDTGTCQEYEQLKAKLPPMLISMLELQGVGPKKISLFWHALEITSIDELEAAARAQRLRVLPGMGEKSEKKIFRAIQEYRQRGGRIRLDEGLEIAASLIANLQERVAPEQIAYAGSLRRRKDTVGDVDLLVSCGVAPSQAIEAFTSHGSVRSVLAKGDTKASVILSRGVQADLRVIDSQSFGAALQYFTGSKEHNVALRERAKRMGYKINEYGVFRIDDNSRIAGTEELEVYSALDLPLIPPELREGHGEIEKAERNELPRLIELRDIQGDLHVHTVASDGRDTVFAMAQAGLEAGYQYIGITDHSKAVAVAHGLDEKRLIAHLDEIDRVRKAQPGIAILKGIEVDILAEGALDLSEEALSGLDVVVASIHSRFNMSEREMTLRVCRALENRFVNILAHPTGRLLTRREPYPVNLQEVIKVALQNRVCLEINAYPERLDLSDVHCRMAKENGVLLSINSDSHNRQMLHYMKYGIYTARRGWLEPQDVINTYVLDDLRRVLKKEIYAGSISRSLEKR